MRPERTEIMEDKRVIRVTGRGRLKIRPDMTRLTLTVTGLDKVYGKALEESTRKTEQLKDVFAQFGFKRADLKTLHFSVDTEYESYQDGNNWKQRFTGYRYNHILKLEFESDNDRLGRILFALGLCAVSPELKISYTVRDKEAAKNELLGRAVADAKAKAAVLAEAAGVTLLTIQSIDYSWGEISFETAPMNRPVLMKAMAEESAAGSFDMDIEPDDIDVSDTVTLVWEIA